MAVAIRLKRMGTTKKPFYRIVATDARTRRDGRCIEELGYYDPLREAGNVKIDLERVDYWKGRGARLSDTVRSLLSRFREEQGVG